MQNFTSVNDNHKVIFDNFCKCIDNESPMSKSQQFIEILNMKFPNFYSNLNECNQNIISN